MSTPLSTLQSAGRLAPLPVAPRPHSGAVSSAAPRPAGGVASARRDAMSRRGVMATKAITTEVSAVAKGVEAAPAPAFRMVHSYELEGGRLDIRHWKGDQMIRVWIPPGYSSQIAVTRGYPVLYLQDGQNLFDGGYNGSSWGAAQTASQLIRDGTVPPFVIVGIDHSGVTRSLDYTPCKPGQGPKNFRSDAESWPGGGVTDYLDDMWNLVVPAISKAYGLATDPARIATGGSSFGGIATLVNCMTHGSRFGAALVESPSLWIGGESFLDNDCGRYQGPWPSRVFLGMGGKEWSGTGRESHEADEFDGYFYKYTERLAGMMEYNGCSTENGALAWEITPGAAHTEAAWAERLPRALTHLLSPWWGHEIAALEKAAPEASSPFLLMPAAPVAGGPVRVMTRGTDDVAEGTEIHVSFGREHEPVVATLQTVPGTYGLWLGAGVEAPSGCGEMLVSMGPTPKNQEDLYVRIYAPGVNTCLESAESIIKRAVQAMGSNPAAVAQTKPGHMFFTMPEVPIAGAPAKLYMNRKASVTPLQHCAGLQLVGGFNDWQDPIEGRIDMAPAHDALPWSDGEDWWVGEVLLPEGTRNMSFVFTDGGDVWDNCGGSNFHIDVSDDLAVVSNPRAVVDTRTLDSAVGRMDIMRLEEGQVTVWMPKEYNRKRAPSCGYPILYIANDGDIEGLAKISMAMEDLMTEGVIPPCIIAAVPQESAETLYHEIMPVISSIYPVSTHPGLTAIAADADIALEAAGMADIFGGVVFINCDIDSALAALDKHPDALSGTLPEAVSVMNSIKLACALHSAGMSDLRLVHASVDDWECVLSNSLKYWKTRCNAQS